MDNKSWLTTAFILGPNTTSKSVRAMALQGLLAVILGIVIVSPSLGIRHYRAQGAIKVTYVWSPLTIPGVNLIGGPPATRDPCSRPCILRRGRICGSDGVIYPNKCVLEAESCRSKKSIGIKPSSFCKSGEVKAYFHSETNLYNDHLLCRWRDVQRKMEIKRKADIKRKREI